MATRVKIKAKKPKQGAIETLEWALQDLKIPYVRELHFAPDRQWRFDFSFPAKKVAVEVEGGIWSGGRHTRPQGFLGDMEKYNRAIELGWAVLRYDTQSVLALSCLPQIRAVLANRTTIRLTEVS